MSTTLNRRTALIGGTSALAGSLLFTGSMLARQESTPTPEDLDLDDPDMDPSRLLDAAVNAQAIVEQDLSVSTPGVFATTIDNLMQRGSDLITSAETADEPRREALGGVALFAAAHVLIKTGEGADVPSQTAAASRVLLNAQTAITNLTTPTEEETSAIDPDLVTLANSLYASAYDDFNAGLFENAVRQAQAGALVAASGRLLAGDAGVLGALGGQRGIADPANLPRRQRRVRERNQSPLLALAAPIALLLKPITAVDVPPPQN